jgi:ParB/RepB/Spo0J family partition protein
MSETITQIQLDQLHESPFNPRKTFIDIDELATNILAEGRIHQPLLVRPRLTNPLRDDLNDGYEIVFGHRRYRAAERACLATVPCMVRAMSDAEARSAQIAENLARNDVHPIEEAEGFAEIIAQDGITADELATVLGKSRSYVYGRLKLLQACPEVRQACLAGEIGSEAALLVARLRTDKLQAKALAAIKAEHRCDLKDGGKASHRAIQSLLAEKFTLQLQGAIFDPADAALLPAAGACGDCPKRTGNAPEYADLVEGTANRWGGHRPDNADTCTDPDCFDAKRQAHLARNAAALQADGKVVITGNKARASLSAVGEVKGAYVELSKVKALLKKLPKKGTAAAQDLPQPQVVLIQDQRTGKTVQAVARADLVAAGAAKQEELPLPDNNKARHEAQERSRQAEEAKAAVENKRRMALLLHVRQVAAGRQRDEFDLRMVAAAAFAGVDYNERGLIAELHGTKDQDALKRQIDHMGVPELTALVLDCCIVDGVRVNFWNLHSKPGPLLALANHYGVDVKTVMAGQPAEATSTPASAGASALKRELAATSKKKAATVKRPAVKYFDPATRQTWTGRGLRPAWIRAAIAGGKSLSDFEAKDEAGFAGARQAQSELLAEAEA